MKIEERLEKIETSLYGTKEIFNTEEVAAFTGLSKSYIYKLTSTCMIPHFKPNGKICYYNKVEIIKWLQRNRISTMEEIRNKANTIVTIKKPSRWRRST